MSTQEGAAVLHTSFQRSEQAEQVLFLHGSGFTGGMWHEITNRLPEIGCIVPDLPGHGRSIAVPPTSFSDAADAVADVIASEGCGIPVHVVGISLGAYVGFRLLQRHSSLVERAILSGFHVLPMPRPTLMKLMGNVMSPVAATRWFRRRMARSLGVPEDRIRLNSDDPMHVSARAIRAANRCAVDFAAIDNLSEIATPALVVAGEREHSIIRNSLPVLEARMPNCTARIAAGLGHAWCLEEPDLFTDTVRSWIRNERLPSGLIHAK